MKKQIFWALLCLFVFPLFTDAHGGIIVVWIIGAILIRRRQEDASSQTSSRHALSAKDIIIDRSEFEARFRSIESKLKSTFADATSYSVKRSDAAFEASDIKIIATNIHASSDDITHIWKSYIDDYRTALHQQALLRNTIVKSIRDVKTAHPALSATKKADFSGMYRSPLYFDVSPLPPKFDPARQHASIQDGLVKVIPQAFSQVSRGNMPWQFAVGAIVLGVILASSHNSKKLRELKELDGKLALLKAEMQSDVSALHGYFTTRVLPTVTAGLQHLDELNALRLSAAYIDNAKATLVLLRAESLLGSDRMG